MTRMIAVYVGADATRFDLEYYDFKHVALAMECWCQYGLESAEAFYPAGAGDGYLSMGVYRFRDPGDVETALAAPETNRLMADVKNFTDATHVLRSILCPIPPSR